jgi:hypothetical protein
MVVFVATIPLAVMVVPAAVPVPLSDTRGASRPSLRYVPVRVTANVTPEAVDVGATLAMVG